jgi:hypothetical protein
MNLLLSLTQFVYSLRLLNASRGLFYFIFLSAKVRTASWAYGTFNSHPGRKSLVNRRKTFEPYQSKSAIKLVGSIRCPLFVTYILASRRPPGN